MPKKGREVPVEIRDARPEQLAHLRHEILWPAIALEDQLLPYDFLPTTRHFGAFLENIPSDILSSIPGRYRSAPSAPQTSSRSDIAPVGHLTITLESYPQPQRLSPELQELALTHHQLHKFAVLTQLQGYGIGRALVEAALKDLSNSLIHADKGILLHLDSRRDQRGLYERLGFHCLDEEVFIKRGPTGTGPPTEYVRMGMVLSRQLSDAPTQP